MDSNGSLSPGLRLFYLHTDSKGPGSALEYSSYTFQSRNGLDNIGKLLSVSRHSSFVKIRPKRLYPTVTFRDQLTLVVTRHEVNQ